MGCEEVVILKGLASTCIHRNALFCTGRGPLKPGSVGETLCRRHFRAGERAGASCVLSLALARVQAGLLHRGCPLHDILQHGSRGALHSGAQLFCIFCSINPNSPFHVKGCVAVRFLLVSVTAMCADVSDVCKCL